MITDVWKYRGKSRRGQQARTLPDMFSSDAGPLSYPLIYSSKVMIISLFDSTVMPDKYRHNGK
ncbi:TPA: hypothetical protein HL354_22820 [Escherichia coli]|uniref:Uncharacterized protein n=2 Tax=Escherichia coli TaxID=562 RepID=A0A2G9A4L2_ECOLX|nr:hypothetical protein DLJ63_02630 [Escherichia coli]AXY45941.1 hypothetical protein CIW80_08720 [Escherichia coli Nissle 1917]EFJ90445.1 hypothetical protein HMPREF9531_04504 [Escherichia coli MS 45-1]EFN8566472.1 hypothetical protein [Escherichia coli O25]EFU50830.1 hypothetical protein HMPREF9544_04128 [Escherichia coli MS 153-1]EFW2042539.1 hypothetical protein [Shigella flexneri]ESE15011.1 hypothetical protein HMPREF1623_05118 [Escherichia coli 910096-2]OYL45050.1 hypothetical protein 